MAKINDATAYPSTTPATDDRVIGTDISDTANDANGETVSFTMENIVKLITSVVLGQGTSAAPALRLGSTNSGWYSTNGFDWTWVRAGAKYLSLGFNKAVLASTSTFGWSSSSSSEGTVDTQLVRDAADTVAQQRSTNSQEFRVYGTYTDASNYERISVRPDEVAVESAGTGTANIDLNLTPAGTGKVRFGTHSAVGAETITGYIEVKDAAGTVRKLAVIS